MREIFYSSPGAKLFHNLYQASDKTFLWRDRTISVVPSSLSKYVKKKSVKEERFFGRLSPAEG